jgi:ABC-type transport system substrate-binding protein
VLFLAGSSTARGLKEGGTFRVASETGGIDPALFGDTLLQPACGTLMGYPQEPPPEGLRLRPELAEAQPVVSRDRRTYTFTVRKDARFSTGAAVTARAFARALERIRDPAMQSPAASDFQHVRGVVAKGRTLTLMTGLCAVPPNLPLDPEGAKAPLPSAAPYYAAEYVPGERLVLERNRFYKGNRVHHVNRFVADLRSQQGSMVDDVASGKFDWAGINASTSGQAVNFAVDRRALTRELGPYGGQATDQYLLPVMPGFRDERIYPLKGPDLKKARELARGRTRAGRAVLYTPDRDLPLATAKIVQRNLKAIGLDVEIRDFPPIVGFGKMATPGEPFDIGYVGFSGPLARDPSFLSYLFDGGTIGQPGFGNWSDFNSPEYNRLLGKALRLTGAERYRVYGELDVRLTRDVAPAVPWAALNNHEFVSARVGCVVLNPQLDLTGVCLK